MPAKVRRCAAERLDRLRLQRFRDLVGFQCLVGGARKFVDDRLRRAGGRRQAKPQHRHAIRHAGLDHGRQLRHDRAAPRLGDAEREELAGRDMPHHR
jgi:hypothetical protein